MGNSDGNWRSYELSLDRLWTYWLESPHGECFSPLFNFAANNRFSVVLTPGECPWAIHWLKVGRVTSSSRQPMAASVGSRCDHGRAQQVGGPNCSQNDRLAGRQSAWQIIIITGSRNVWTGVRRKSSEPCGPAARSRSWWKRSAERPHVSAAWAIHHLTTARRRTKVENNLF